MSRKTLSYLLLLLCVPLLLVIGSLFGEKQYAFVSLAVILLALAALFISFEKKEAGSRKLVIIAVMTALSVTGRFVFAVLPGFKPVTAIVIVTALYFGAEAGFLTGALSAFISNFYFGQGPWTPFQMFAWGLIGLLAAVLAKLLKASRLLLSIYGILAGVAFSMLLDVWTVLWYSNGFNLSMYLAALVSSAPSTIAYAVSNVVFLLVLSKPFDRKLERIRIKYGL